MKRQRLATFALLALLAAAAAWGAGPSEQELIAVLKSDAALHEKARACEQLAVVGGKNAVPVLASLLGDEQLGDYARFGLEPMEDPAVDKVFRDAMGRLQGRLLAGAVSSIGVRRDPKAVAGLRKLARDPGKGVAPEALMALGMIATDPAIRTIRKTLTDGPVALRAAAADAALTGAERLVAQDRRDEAIGLYDAIRKANLPGRLRAAATYGAIVTRGKAGVPLLMVLLKSDDPGMAGVALRAARDLRGPEVSRALTAELKTASPGVQVQLIQVLVDRGDTEARKDIEALAASSEPDVRLASLKALGEIGDASAVGLLIKALGGGGEAATAAGGSLRSLKGEGVDAAILTGLAGTAGEARAELIDVLANRRYTSATPALLKEAASDDESIAKAAFRALGVLAGPTDLHSMVERLLAVKHPSVVPEAENAVVAVAAERADAVLAALASASSPDARASLLRVLGRMGGERAYEAVAKASADPDLEVKDTAVRILASWPDARALDALMGIAKDARNETHRVLALRGYVRLLGLGATAQPGNAAAKFAEAMALARTADTKKTVLGGLASVPHGDALGLAMAAVGDPDVGPEAEWAAVKIARSIAESDRDAALAAMRKIAAASKDQSVTAQAREIISGISLLADAITQWRVSGPYTAKDKMYNELFDISFGPEKPGEKAVEWRPLPAGTDPKSPWLLDLLKAMPGEQRAAYALTWVHSASDQPARLQLGTDDGVKAWLNGALVHANNANRAAKPYTDNANITLKAGWNPLLLKITQNTSRWEFCARICDPNGDSLDNIRTDPAHEGNPSPTAAAKQTPPKPAARIADYKPAPREDKAFFNGKDLTGWSGTKGYWKVEGGAIVAHSDQPVPRNEFLWSPVEVKDFYLAVDVKLVPETGNAGVQFRSRKVDEHGQALGYQADAGRDVWGKLYHEHGRGKLDWNDRGDRAAKPGEWNRYEILAVGHRIWMALNGALCVAFEDPEEELSGLIALQLHAGAPQTTQYRIQKLVHNPEVALVGMSEKELVAALGQAGAKLEVKE